MTNDIVIKVENLSKRYRLGELHKQTNSFREKVTNSFRHALRSMRRASNPMPALWNACPVECEAYSSGAEPIPPGRHALYTNSRYSNDLLTPSRKYGKKEFRHWI
jgi:hypothetical protein